jgi:hypothetical protein
MSSCLIEAAAEDFPDCLIVAKARRAWCSHLLIQRMTSLLGLELM